MILLALASWAPQKIDLIFVKGVANAAIASLPGSQSTTASFCLSVSLCSTEPKINQMAYHCTSPKPYSESHLCI